MASRTTPMACSGVSGGAVMASTYSCADGYFEFSGLTTAKQRTIMLTFRGEGFDDQTMAAGVGQDVQLVPKASLPGSITGTVMTAETRSPIEAARVTARPSTGNLGFSVRTGGEGQYVILGLADDEYKARATSSQYPQSGIDGIATVAPGQNVNLDFKFRAAPGDSEGAGEDAAEGSGGCAAEAHKLPQPHDVPGDMLLLALLGLGLVGAGRKQRLRKEWSQCRTCLVPAARGCAGCGPGEAQGLGFDGENTASVWGWGPSDYERVGVGHYSFFAK